MVKPSSQAAHIKGCHRPEPPSCHHLVQNRLQRGQPRTLAVFSFFHTISSSEKCPTSLGNIALLASIF